MVPNPLPSFDELPHFKEFPGCAWEVWGKADQLGTINLLTQDVVQRAAKEEIRTGQTVSLNWPINFPQKTTFGRKTPEIESIHKTPGVLAVMDDEIHINTQSGSQWDGLKHYGLLAHDLYYNNTPAASLPIGKIDASDPTNIDPERIRLGIHNWAQHGICGRGVLLDMVHYYTASGSPLPYDPWSTHAFTVPELEACAKHQGVQFRQADILLIRAGFTQKYYTTTSANRSALSNGNETFAGIEQSEDMKRFLWNNHFAAVASDQPALEAWPAKPLKQLHQTIIGLWGMPIGEFFDLEGLSKICAETGRYSFFFSSWPLNVLGGVASPPNAAAYF